MNKFLLLVCATSLLALPQCCRKKTCVIIEQEPGTEIIVEKRTSGPVGWSKEDFTHEEMH